MRKGYYGEYRGKKLLQTKYGSNNVFKIAIGSHAGDFIILKPKSPEIEKIVEIKTTKRKKWYPSRREKKQFLLLKNLAEEHNILVEYWIKEGNADFKILSLDDVADQYFGGLDEEGDE